MKRLLIMLAACSTKDVPSPAPPPPAPRNTLVDATACPGEPSDCAACASGTGSACARVGYAAAADAEQAAWFERGCKLDDLESCRGATMHGTHDDYVRTTERVRVLEAALLAATRAKCDAHDEKACVDVGTWLAFGTGGAKKDQAAALAILDASCGRGNLDACGTASVASDDPRIRELEARRACKAGRAKSCGDLLGFDGKLQTPNARAFARAELERQCRAKSQEACGVLEEQSTNRQTTP
jgi:hypothetical protein